VKRHLDIEPVIPELSGGMAGAVAYGTARSLRLNFNEESILGKTGLARTPARASDGSLRMPTPILDAL